MFSFAIISTKSTDYQQVLSLRNKILRKPLGLKLTATDIHNDISEIIIGMFNKQHQIMGCVQLKPLDNNTLKLRQMAVDTPYQNQGFGKKIVTFAEQTAQEKSYKIIELNAREIAVDFYKKLGYSVVSELFFEVGIPHFKMQKKI